MKQFKIKPIKKTFSFGEMHCISLGERGRGRYEEIVPCQSDLLPTDYIQIIPTKTGKPKIVKGGDSKGWIARISCEGTYTKNTDGYARVHKDDLDKVNVLAKGYGAEGDAGRCGTWYDYLLQIEDNTLIRVKEHGGYKRPPYFIYFSETAAFVIQEEELDIFLDGKDYQVSEEWSESFVKFKNA